MKDRIKKLNELFPRINAVCTSEWDGEEGGIWFRQEGACHADGMPYFDYWNTEEQVHPAVQAALVALGLFAEPNDPGTWFAWEA
jgi:hypothetical protein